MDKINSMLNLNIQSLAQLSFNYVRDYKDKHATLINVASIGGYIMFPEAAPYCATKFYVASLTEGMAENLKRNNKPMRAKVLAPAGTATEFFDLANNIQITDNGPQIGKSYTPPEIVAQYTYDLYQSDKVVGYVGSAGELLLQNPKFPAVQ